MISLQMASCPDSEYRGLVLFILAAWPSDSCEVSTNSIFLPFHMKERFKACNLFLKLGTSISSTRIFCYQTQPLHLTMTPLSFLFIGNLFFFLIFLSNWEADALCEAQALIENPLKWIFQGAALFAQTTSLRNQPTFKTGSHQQIPQNTLIILSCHYIFCYADAKSN